MTDNLTEIRLPRLTGCWESCGECRNGDIFVQSVLVKPGERVDSEDSLLIIETGKMALDYPSPVAGTIVDIFVEDYDVLSEGMLIATIRPDE